MKKFFMVCMVLLCVCNNPIEQVRYVINYEEVIEIRLITNQNIHSVCIDQKLMDKYDLTFIWNYKDKIITISHPAIEDFEIIKIILRSTWTVDTLIAEDYRQ